jgi:hypothetical protein
MINEWISSQDFHLGGLGTDDQSAGRGCDLGFHKITPHACCNVSQVLVAQMHPIGFVLLAHRDDFMGNERALPWMT